MTAALLLAAILGTGQAAIGPPVFRMADPQGRAWTSPDPVWLRHWVSPECEPARNRAWPLRPSNPVAPPAVVPASPGVPPAGGAVPNYGLDRDKFGVVTGGKEWAGGGPPINFEPRGDATGAAGTRPRRLHLTVIGPTRSAAQSVIRAWEADPRFKALEEGMGDRLAVKAYAADDVMVRAVGLPAGGQPDVVLQWDKGQVLYRANSDPGVETIVGEIRKRDPSYDPTMDPSGGIDFFGGWGWPLVGVLALVLLFSLGSQKP